MKVLHACADDRVRYPADKVARNSCELCSVLLLSETFVRATLRVKHLLFSVCVIRSFTSISEIDWSRRAIEVLITAYQEEASLFNPEDALYHNRNARKEKMIDVAKKVAAVLPGVTVEDCKTKFSSLRSHYGAEWRRIRASKKSGAGAGGIYEPNVWWFPLLHFLKDYIMPRNTSTNLPDRFVPASYRSETLECEPVDHLDHSYTVQSQSTTVFCDSRSYPVYNCSASQSPQPSLPIDSTIDSLTDRPELVEVEVDLPNSSAPSASSELITPSHYSKQGKKRKREEEGPALMATVLERVSAKFDTSNDDPIAKFVASELKKTREQTNYSVKS